MHNTSPKTKILKSLTCNTCDQRPKEGRSLKQCAACRGAFYCSLECQKQDWFESHKNKCRRSQTGISPEIFYRVWTRSEEMRRQMQLLFISDLCLDECEPPENPDPTVGDEIIIGGLMASMVLEREPDWKIAPEDRRPTMCLPYFHRFKAFRAEDPDMVKDIAPMLRQEQKRYFRDVLMGKRTAPVHCYTILRIFVIGTMRYINIPVTIEQSVINEYRVTKAEHKMKMTETARLLKEKIGDETVETYIWSLNKGIEVDEENAYEFRLLLPPEEWWEIVPEVERIKAQNKIK